MTTTATHIISQGMDAYIRQIKKKKQLYVKLLKLAAADKSKEKIFRITDPGLFNQAIRYFGAALDAKKAGIDLMSIYEAAVHKGSGALLIANKGATLYALSPRTDTPHIIRHVGCCVYLPGLGVELVNIGLVGDVYQGKIVLRSESACSPSFLFGSQRCNCAYQWESIRELAAQFNTVKPPTTRSGREFENWVQGQCTYSRGKHLFRQSGPGFVLLHIDTQNGMGSGYSKNEFSFDLFTRASMRHRGEYSSEQIAGVTMAGGFKALGLRPDPRQENKQIGYQVTRILLDFLGTSENLLFLTNNQFKLKNLHMNGYEVERIKTLGAINTAGAQEAEERGCEFDHLDIDGTPVNFEHELQRLKAELSKKLKE